MGPVVDENKRVGDLGVNINELTIICIMKSK